MLSKYIKSSNFIKNPSSLVRINGKVISYKYSGPGPGPKYWEPSTTFCPNEALLLIEIKGSFAKVLSPNGIGWVLMDSLRAIHEKR